MSHEFSPHEDQMAANEAVLRQSELGIILQDAYIAAVNEDPRLEDIAIISVTDPDEPKPAFMLPVGDERNTTGRQEIHIRLDNLDDTLAVFKKSMEHTPKNTAIVAETLGIPPEEVTPQLLFVYSTLHEMGHALEAMDYEAAGKSHAEHMHEQRAERAKLPIGRLLVSQLLSEDSPNRQYVEQHWNEASRMASENYSAFTGEDVKITTMEELIDATSHVHRHTKFEAAADKFAATVLQLQPVMLMQLTGDITRFRNYPQHAGEGIAA
jgi:hypothetical protein